MGALGRSVLALAATAAPGCLRATTHQCLDDRECGSSGRCEPSGFCSFVDPGCGGGRRYGDGAGALAGACLDSGAELDGGTDAGPDADRDDDGVLDVLDNCPEHGNPDQHDEDDDEIGDVCDNCPHLANVDQLDVGELEAGFLPDGVGDECDPSPGSAGNAIVFFDPFTAPDAAWTASGNSDWNIVADVARVSSLAGVAVFAHPLGIAPGSSDLVITTSATPSATGNPGAAGYAGVGAAARLSAPAAGGISCSAVLTTVLGVGTYLIDIAQGQALNGAQLEGESGLDGRTFLITYTVRAPGNGEDRCVVTSPADTITVNADTGSDSIGSIGLAAARVTADFDYIVVIRD